VEPASIDEFYLDMTGTERLYKHAPLYDTAVEIRQTVLDVTGIAVSIGGGTSRLIAKLASKRAKPHRGTTAGVVIIEPGGEQEFLEGLQLADIPGIGPRFQERLAVRGLRSVKDALALSENELTEWLGERGGKWLYNKVRGVDRTRVADSTVSKSMSHERTFATDLHDDAAIDRELQRLALNVSADLRSKGRRARTITVKLRDADFTTRQASRTMPAAVAADSVICETARALTARLRRQRRTGVRLLGVALSRFDDDQSDTEQLSLLDSDLPNEVPLLRAVDDINERFGRHSIVRASTVDSDVTHPAGPE
jgi:DNA polymerase-4